MFYAGPNLVCTGIDTNDNLTLVIQKLNDAICNPALLPGGLLRTEDGLPLTAITKIITDNTGVQTSLRLSTARVTIVPPVNTTGPIIDMPAVDNAPGFGVPDALVINVRGHNGATVNQVAGITITMQNNKNVGFGVVNSTSLPDATNSICFLAALKATTNGNYIAKGKRGSVDVYEVTDTGTVRATQLALYAMNTAPLSASDTGTLGEIRIVNGFVYVCVATDTWQRAALTTF